MADDRQEQIRRRAHAIWEREGRPHGEHERHWLQASAEIDGHGATGKKPVTTKPKAPARAAAQAKGAGAALAEHAKDAAKPARRTRKPG